MKKEDAKTAKLFDLTHTMAGELLSECEYPWEVLPKIGDFIKKTGPSLPSDEWDNPSENVWIHKTVKIVNPSCTTILGPAIIGPETEVRPGAFVRQNVLIGSGCVVGNSSEYKNVIIFDSVQTPHFNYIGDSVLGYKSHTGCQSLTSNVKSDKKLVVLHFEDGDVETGLKKFGAMVGDYVEVGCGAVLNPGTIVGKGSMIQPLSSVRGTVSEKHIYKSTGKVVAIRE